MKYINTRIHYPKPEHVTEILDVTRQIADTASSYEGYVDTAAWNDKEHERIVIVSVWDTEEQAAEASTAMHPMVADLLWNEWEREPPENFQELPREV